MLRPWSEELPDQTPLGSGISRAAPDGCAGEEHPHNRQEEPPTCRAEPAIARHLRALVTILRDHRASIGIQAGRSRVSWTTFSQTWFWAVRCRGVCAGRCRGPRGSRSSARSRWRCRRSRAAITVPVVFVAKQTPQAHISSSCGGRFGWVGGVFIEQRVVLEAVVELAEHAVEEVALCGGVPVSVVVAAPAVVGFGAG